MSLILLHKSEMIYYRIFIRYKRYLKMPGYVVKLLVVEDSAIIGSRVMDLLATISSVKLLGQAKSLKEAKKICSDSSPDIILLDTRLPDGQGLNMIRELKDLIPDSRIIILSNSHDAFFRRKCYEHGAAYVLDKSTELPGITEIVENMLTKSGDST